ncbi:hypothetical protein GOD97_13475 [Paeniclostridium sordellii]|uniref:hypothetical protein n=1 Tax=Paraclostridium sordellii TaxID=1505 RepID=UPI0012ED8EE0|nr:hypothetical protein [Paeniclostridium sordellii]MVO75745.1 hypothetical protein [Paeniclostridium sordellii]
MGKMKMFEHKIENINATLINIIVLGLGIILILIAIVSTGNENIEQIFLSIGSSLIASSIVVFLSSRYLVNQNKLTEIIQEWKMTGIFETRADMNRSSNFYLENNKNNLDIVAFGLKSFRDSKKEIIKEKINRGMRIRILTLSPNSEFLKEREKVEKEIEGQIKNTIIQLAKWVEDLQQNQLYKGQVEIRYYDSIPIDFYFGLDEVVFVGPYMYGVQSQQTISYEFKRGGTGFNYYNEYFNKLWENNEFCKERY